MPSLLLYTGIIKMRIFFSSLSTFLNNQNFVMNTLKKEGTQWNQSDPESVSLYTSAVRMATVKLEVGIQ